MVTKRPVVGAEGSRITLVTRPPFAEKAKGLNELICSELVIEIVLLPLVESIGKP